MNARIRIGIMSQDKIRARTLAIAKGEYKPKKDDPKIWFPSIRSVAEVLSDDNRELLKIIASVKPASITNLADVTGRKVSNLSRTLKTLANYGIVELVRTQQTVRPVAKYTSFEIEAA